MKKSAHKLPAKATNVMELKYRRKPALFVGVCVCVCWERGEASGLRIRARVSVWACTHAHKLRVRLRDHDETLLRNMCNMCGMRVRVWVGLWVALSGKKMKPQTPDLTQKSSKKGPSRFARRSSGMIVLCG